MGAQKKLSIIKPNIFEYHDHLAFLKDWIDFLKSIEPGFSLRMLSQKSEVAAGYLPMVFSGKRSLTEKTFDKILPNLKLQPQERKYLQLLRTVGESDQHQVRLMAIQEMSRLAPFRKAQNKEVEVYKYLTKWSYVAIREMVALNDFDPSPEWIQNKLNGSLSLVECKEALQFLENKGFVSRDGSGRYYLPDANLDCKEGIFKASLGEFHRQMLELAYKAIDSTPREQRHLLGHTFAVSSEDIPELKAILNEAMEKIEQLGLNVKNKSEVYQVELAAFPLTKSLNDQTGEGS